MNKFCLVLNRPESLSCAPSSQWIRVDVGVDENAIFAFLRLSHCIKFAKISFMKNDMRQSRSNLFHLLFGDCSVIG